MRLKDDFTDFQLPFYGSSLQSNVYLNGVKLKYLSASGWRIKSWCHLATQTVQVVALFNAPLKLLQITSSQLRISFFQEEAEKYFNIVNWWSQVCVWAVCLLMMMNEHVALSNLNNKKIYQALIHLYLLMFTSPDVFSVFSFSSLNLAVFICI